MIHDIPAQALLPGSQIHNLESGIHTRKDGRKTGNDCSTAFLYSLKYFEVQTRAPVFISRPNTQFSGDYQ